MILDCDGIPDTTMQLEDDEVSEAGCSDSGVNVLAQVLGNFDDEDEDAIGSSEDVRDPMEAFQDRLLQPSLNVEDGKNCCCNELTCIEKLVFEWLCELREYAYFERPICSVPDLQRSENSKPEKSIFTLLHHFYIDVLVIVIFHFQLIGLTLPPSLPWDGDTRIFVSLLQTLTQLPLSAGLILAVFVSVGSIAFVLFSLLPCQFNFLKFVIGSVLGLLCRFSPAFIIPLSSRSCHLVFHYFQEGQLIWIPIMLLQYLLSAWGYISALCIYEWKPGARVRIGARVHSRFTGIETCVAEVLVLLVVFFDYWRILVILVMFFLVVILFALHLYYLQWSSIVVNQIVASLLLSASICCVVSVAMTSLSMLFPFLQHSLLIIPRVAFVSVLALGCGIASILVKMRLDVMKLTIDSHGVSRLYSVLFRIIPGVEYIPKGGFEVEIAARSVGAFGLKKNRLHFEEEVFDQETSLSERINSKALRWRADMRILEKVVELYNRVRFLGLNNHAVTLSRSTLEGFVFGDSHEALSLLENCGKQSVWTDFRFSRFQRTRYFRKRVEETEEEIEEMEF